MTEEQNTNKPLLLLFPFEQLAHYLRCLTLARHLAPYFEIRVVHSHRYAAFVERERFETFECPGLNTHAVLDCVKRFDFTWLNEHDLERTLQHQITAIEKAQPAVVLGDTLPTLKMAAEKTGVPYVALMNGYMSRYYAGTRSMSWRFPLYPYFKFFPKAVLDYFTKTGEQLAFQKIHQPFQRLRKRYGLLKKYSYAVEMEGDLNLLCDLPALFPQRPLPSNYRLISPLIYESNVAADGILKKLDATKKTLFVSMGSTGDWQQAAFLNDPYFRQYNIITAGDSTGVVQGVHVIATAFASAQDLFPKVDLVLCHGGNGTIYQALQHGIPVLCKTAHFEQEWNVQAVQKNNLGASLDAMHRNDDYIKAVERWVTKKGSVPFRQIQQQLAATNFAGLGDFIRNSLPTFETVYYTYEKKSA